MDSRIGYSLLLAAIGFCGMLPSVLSAQDSNPLPDYVVEQFGVAPPVPDGPLSPAIQFAARVAFIDSTALSVWDKNQELAVAAIGRSGDPRLAWIISDMLRFAAGQQPQQALTLAASGLLGKTFDVNNAWRDISNHLLAWNIPAPPDYLNYKSAIFTLNVPGWDELFVAGDIDWRLISWGGVLIDNRAYDKLMTVAIVFQPPTTLKSAALKMQPG